MVGPGIPQLSKLMGIFSKPRLRGHDRREDMPEGLWVKCPDCGALIHALELKQNHHVCVHCGHHFLIDSRERITMLADPDSFEETEAGLISANPLGFAGYPEKTAALREKTGLNEAILSGRLTIEGQRVIRQPLKQTAIHHDPTANLADANRAQLPQEPPQIFIGKARITTAFDHQIALQYITALNAIHVQARDPAMIRPQNFQCGLRGYQLHDRCWSEDHLVIVRDQCFATDSASHINGHCVFRNAGFFQRLQENRRQAVACFCFIGGVRGQACDEHQ